MREIKFRAWDRFKGEMVELTLLGLQWTYVDELTVYGVDNERGGVAKSKSDKVPVMQYTGLKDKNGKEIYEGDILNEIEGGPGPEDNWYFVEWIAGAFRHLGEEGEPLGDFDLNEYEVIGNIYENPELLDMEDRNDDSAKEELAQGDDGEGVEIGEQQ